MTRRLLAILILFAWPAFAAAGSNSLLALNADGSKLIAANSDAGTVSVVDLRGRKLLHEFPVGDRPEGTAWIPGGELALVTLYHTDEVAIVDTAAGKILHKIKVPDEPYGVITTSDGKLAYITHDYPGTISEIDIATAKVLRVIPVCDAGIGCRGLAISADNKTLYATEYFTSTLVGLNRATGEKIGRWAGDAQDNLARHVELHPQRAKAYLVHTRDRVTGFDARGSVFPHVSFCDLDAKPNTKNRRTLALDTYNGVTVVTNPWESALSPDGSLLYTIYASTDDANVSKTIDDDYQEVERVGRVKAVGKHPRAVRVSPTGDEVYIYVTLDHALNIFNSTLTEKLASIKIATPAHTAEWRRGKELFHAANQPMGSARWISCSSCHPDGLHDGRVWQNPEGPRKTPNLFGMAHTHPLHWSGDRDEAQDFEYTIRGKLMQGRGLARGQNLKPRESFRHYAEAEQTTAGLSADLDALAVYQNSFTFRRSPHAAGPGQLAPEAARGKVLFHNSVVNCASCHNGPYFTDSSLTRPFTRHDVGTGGGPNEKLGPDFDTPTLLGVYRVNSYLHDGRAKTLHEVLTKFNADDKHGKTSHLSPAEVDDLVAYIKSLPYDTPPEVTPNSVKFRLSGPLTSPAP